MKAIDELLNKVTWLELLAITGLLVVLAIMFLMWGLSDLFEVVEIHRALVG